MSAATARIHPDLIPEWCEAPAFHHPHDTLHIHGILKRLPHSLQANVVNTYRYQYENKGRQAANLYLWDVQEYIKDKTLLILGDEAIRQKAERLAKVCDIKNLVQAEKYLASVGLSLPKGETEESQLARVKCPIWWERALRRKQDREQEMLAIQLGFVRKSLHPYCSNGLLNRILARHQRSLEILKHFEAVSDEGETLDLLEVVKGSLANPEVRRAELMVRLRGFENYADTQGHVGMFYTLTCPSKYHRHSGQVLNEKYQHHNPRMAQKYLCELWARVRAKLKRDGLPIYGFRVAEPHHDGTPHWHLLLFVAPQDQDAITGILKDYALQEDGYEAGASKHRFKVEIIDKSKGGATAYIAKYISKNIDGFGMDDDEESGLAASDAVQRTRAWASAWGIRQFQQIGGAPVGVWRELRRLLEAPGDLEKVREACDAGNWALYLQLQGGAEVSRKDQPFRVYTLESIDAETGEIHQNRYGELIQKVAGVSAPGSLSVETRLKRWTIQAKADQNPMDKILDSYLDDPDFIHSVLNDAQSFSFDSANAQPWSTVNNCTQAPQNTTRGHPVNPRKLAIEEARIAYYTLKRQGNAPPDKQTYLKQYITEYMEAIS